MKVFVTGVAGQLGHDVVKELLSRGIETVGSDILPDCDSKAPYVSLDITDPEAVSRTMADIRPEVLIHCAAWTAVDAAEDEENRQKVSAINAEGTKNLAKARIMCLTDREQSLGSRTAKTMRLSMYTA